MCDPETFTDPGQPLSLQPWLDHLKEESGAFLDKTACRRLQAMADLLREWNEKMNLTSITDDEGIVIRHFLDSLTLLPVLLRQQSKMPPGSTIRLADIGSGAGFPGMVLKIARPDFEVCLMDALAKRVRYLHHAIATLDLGKITAVHMRAEDAARDLRFREAFDVVTARAVASLPVLCEYCLPLVKPGGVFLAMKGDLGQELKQSHKAIRLLGGRFEQSDEFFLQGETMKRTILTIAKVKPTPNAYPRKAGKPEKKPL